MLNKRVVILITIVISIFFLSGCQNNTTGVEFQRVFIYSDCMDFTTTYYSDDEWNKEIKSITIPQNEKNVECSIYDYKKENKGNQIVNEVEWGISSDEWNEKDGLGSDFHFNQIEITWDDNTKEVIEIGSITVACIDSSLYKNIIQAGDYKSKSITDIDEPSVLKLDYSPMIEELYECFDSIDVCSYELKDFVGEGIELGNNEKIIVEADKKKECGYDLIDIDLGFTYVSSNEPNEKSGFVVNLNYHR